jgi:hypothetical protein
MMDVLIYGSFSLAALLLLVLFWRRGELEGRGLEPMGMALPSPAVIDRVFSQEDLCYAQSLPRPIYRSFARDRQAMAMTWIRQIRYTCILLLRRHARTVRRSSALYFWREARIAASFLGILVICELFALAVVTLGPARLKMLIAILVSRTELLQMELLCSYLEAAYETA